ncbi:MAG TPA: hypothetical protein VNF08_06910 [Acidimicrobiales bacterium]|nr:hypothetical protein [Acidimicrobiales bacterium]
MDRAPLALGLVAFALWIFAVNHANSLAMNSYGLVSVLGWPYFFGLVLIVVAFTVELLRIRLRPNHLALLIAVLLFFVFGTASAVEPVAGLESSFIHAGFIQYLLQHGHTLNNYDARFSWPGGFSLAAVLVNFAGLSNALAFLRWFPLTIELLYMAPLIVIARYSGVGQRAAWLGVILFYANNWIYQDYFSPQALNYLFFLVVVATVLACWQPARAEDTAVRGFVRSSVAKVRALFTGSRLRGLEARSEWSSSSVLAVILLISLIALASSMSHQLTPYVLLLELGACLLTRRLARPELIVVVFLFFIGWLSIGASNYWVGHLHQIFGAVGQLTGTFGSNVKSRVTGSVSHRLIVDARILGTIAIYSLGVIGALRRRPDSRALEALAGVPLLLLVALSYGGEGLLRAVLFGLPFVSLLGASALLPNRVGPIRAILPQLPFRRLGRKALGAVVAVVVLVMSFNTVVVRGGNDAYESYTNGERAAVNYTYNHITPGETVGIVAPFLPIGFRDVGLIYVYIAVGQGTVLLPVRASGFVKNHAAFVILSQAQESWGVNVAGYPVVWEANLEGSLLSKGYKIVKAWPTATVLRAPLSIIRAT